MDADVMDVEAAIAALHGEVLDDGVTAAANIYEASNEAGLKDSKTLPLGQTNMLLVDTHKDKPPSKVYSPIIYYCISIDPHLENGLTIYV